MLTDQHRRLSETANATVEIEMDSRRQRRLRPEILRVDGSVHHILVEMTLLHGSQRLYIGLSQRAWMVITPDDRKSDVIRGKQIIDAIQNLYRPELFVPPDRLLLLSLLLLLAVDSTDSDG